MAASPGILLTEMTKQNWEENMGILEVRCALRKACVMEEKKCEVVVVDGWVEEERTKLVGRANLSGTYWVIVIRPQLSRTATTRMCNTSDRSISVLNRPARIDTVSCSFLTMKIFQNEMQTHENT
jgi:hypothetical protein